MEYQLVDPSQIEPRLRFLLRKSLVPYRQFSEVLLVPEFSEAMLQILDRGEMITVEDMYYALRLIINEKGLDRKRAISEGFPIRSARYTLNKLRERMEAETVG